MNIILFPANNEVHLSELRFIRLKDGRKLSELRFIRLKDDRIIVWTKIYKIKGC
jgi:hypothetical protein